MTPFISEHTIEIDSAGRASTLSLEQVDLRRQLVRFGRWAHRLGYTPGTAGNLSARLDDRLILATPTACSKAMLRSSDMVIIDNDGNHIAGSRKVTSEIGMHLTVYRMRPDVRAIVHSHPPISTAFAACGTPLDQPICSEIIMTTGLVPLAPYATTGTDEVGASLEPFIPDHDAVLLANHGLLTYGTSLVDAFMKTETVEHFAQVCLAAHQMRGAIPLQPKDIEKLHNARARYKRNASSPCS
jgi:L-fuculose-phosphate aldolase